MRRYRPCRDSSQEESGRLPIFIRFTEAKHNVRVFFHDITRSVIHESEGAGVVWLGEIVNIRESGWMKGFPPKSPRKIIPMEGMSVKSKHHESTW